MSSASSVALSVEPRIRMRRGSTGSVLETPASCCRSTPFVREMKLRRKGARPRPVEDEPQVTTGDEVEPTRASASPDYTGAPISFSPVILANREHLARNWLPRLRVVSWTPLDPIANLHTNLTPYIFSSLRNPFSVRARDLSSYALAAALR